MSAPTFDIAITPRQRFAILALLRSGKAPPCKSIEESRRRRRLKTALALDRITAAAKELGSASLPDEVQDVPARRFLTAEESKDTIALIEAMAELLGDDAWDLLEPLIVQLEKEADNKVPKEVKKLGEEKFEAVPESDKDEMITCECGQVYAPTCPKCRKPLSCAKEAPSPKRK